MRRQTPNPALEIHSLSLCIGGNNILKDVSFEVPQGAFRSIVGPNGAGKTSLLRCVMGITKGWSGQIRVDSRPLDSYNRRHLARLVSYIPQSDEMPFPYSGREMVTMGRYPHLSPFTRVSPADLAVVERTLLRTGTSSLADRDMRTLSGGERQKLLIAAALAQAAGTMLLDEPTTFLDPRHTEEILSILTELNRSGVTIIMVTHDLNHAVQCADSVTALVDGAVAFDGPSGELMNNRVLRAVYGKDFTLVPHPVSGKLMALPDGRTE